MSSAGRRYHLHGDAATGDQRFQQPIAGAVLLPPATDCRIMQVGDGWRPLGLDLASNVYVIAREHSHLRMMGGGYAGVSTTRPTTLPARSSSITAFTSVNGLVATGTGGTPVRRTRSINSFISGKLPT